MCRHILTKLYSVSSDSPYRLDTASAHLLISAVNAVADHIGNRPLHGGEPAFSITGGIAYIVMLSLPDRSYGLHRPCRSPSAARPLAPPASGIRCG